MTSMPYLRSRSAGPMPDSCRICGEPMLPAHRITSRAAWAVIISRPSHTCAPVHRRRPSDCTATMTRATWAPVHIVKFGRP